ncbi:MAG: ribonuclease [Clostridia bacterium]|jgi:ribonuclease HI|nr:ribonuclease [Clostridia bacterium]
MGKKVYAVKEGFNSETNEKVENKIVNTWAECLKYVKGVKGAKYKSFEDINSAKAYLSEASKMLKKGEDSYPEDCLHIYVDGSYNTHTKKYSYGLAAVKNNVVEYIESESEKDSSEKNIRQIAGELEGAVKGVQYALSKGNKQVVLFHDYEGISHHATGFWERREQSSEDYYNKMNELMSRGIEVIFVKVDSHTGDLFNELVDEKCKEKLSIASDKLVEKWLLKNTISVASEEVKEEILKIAPSRGENIIVVGDPYEKDREKDTGKLLANGFDKLIKAYQKDPKDSKNLIDDLEEEEKTNFIIYLLEQIKE